MSHDEATVLALTPWGSSMLGALQGSTEADRAEIARRACEDAITDARGMVSLQGSLFEKLLVIERFGLYRSHVIRDGAGERGCESIQEFVERAVAPVVQLHKATLYRLKDAVWEAGRLLQRFGTVKADWSHLSMLAGETRKQEKGQGTLAAEEYERVSRQVAEGALTQRDLAVALQKQRLRPPAQRSRIDAKAARPQVRPTPFDELARLASDARRPAARAALDLVPSMDLAEQLLAQLERISIQPVDVLARHADLVRFKQLMGDVARLAATAAEVADRAEAA